MAVGVAPANVDAVRPPALVLFGLRDMVAPKQDAPHNWPPARSDHGVDYRREAQERIDALRTDRRAHQEERLAHQRLRDEAGHRGVCTRSGSA